MILNVLYLGIVSLNCFYLSRLSTKINCRHIRKFWLRMKNSKIGRETKSLIKRPLLAIAGTTTSDRPVISPSTLPTCRATVYHSLVDTTKHPPRDISLMPLPFALSIKPPLPRRGGRWSQDLARVLPAWGTRRRSDRSTSSGRCHPDGTSRGPRVSLAAGPLTSMATQDMICNASGTWNGLLWSRS